MSATWYQREHNCETGVGFEIPKRMNTLGKLIRK
jgi:hypothetical protein